MTDDRAREVNSLVVQAWMKRVGIKADGAMPDLRGVTLADAIEASERMAGPLGERRNADGSISFVVRVEPSRIPGLFAWAVLQTEDTPYAGA